VAGSHLNAGAQPARTDHYTPPFRHSATILFYVALGLGMLAKGPPLFLHIAGALVAYHLCLRRRLPGRWWHHALGLGLFLAISLPWPAHVLRQVPNALELWEYESLGEFGDVVEKARGALFYLPSLPQIMLPWTLIWAVQAIGGVARWWLPADPMICRRRRRNLFPFLWLLLVVVMFSFAGGKKNAYLLPAMPAIALSVGAGLHMLLAGWRIPRLRGRARATLVVLLLTGVAFAGLLPDRTVRAVWPAHTSFIKTDWRVALSTAAIMTLFGLLPYWALRRSREAAWPVAQAVTFAVGIALFFNVIVATHDNRRSAKAACKQALALLAEGGRTISTDKMSEEVAVYLPLDPYAAVRANSQFARRVLYLLDDEEGIAARRRDMPHKPFDPRGWMVEGGRVIAFQQIPVPANPGDVRWKLYEFVVERTALAER
jgi:4-amino-4-deoxy-L-arabinose transferase-like glycosyltransferase